jgi:hypothetical protein
MKRLITFFLLLNSFSHYAQAEHAPDYSLCFEKLVLVKSAHNVRMKAKGESCYSLPLQTCNKDSGKDCIYNTGCFNETTHLTGLPYQHINGKKGIIVYFHNPEGDGLASFVEFPRLFSNENQKFKFTLGGVEYCGEAPVVTRGDKNVYEDKFKFIDCTPGLPTVASINNYDLTVTKLADMALHDLITKNFAELENSKDTETVKSFTVALEACRTNVNQHKITSDVSSIKDHVNIILDKLEKNQNGTSSIGNRDTSISK